MSKPHFPLVAPSPMQCSLHILLLHRSSIWYVSLSHSSHASFLPKTANEREKKHKKESDSLQAINLVLWRSMCCLIELSVSTDGLTWGQEEYHEQQGEAQC